MAASPPYRGRAVARFGSHFGRAPLTAVTAPATIHSSMAAEEYQSITRRWVQEFFAKIRGTFLEGELILGGSSGLFGFSTEAPPFTEDFDFLVREDLVAVAIKSIVAKVMQWGVQLKVLAITILWKVIPGMKTMSRTMTTPKEPEYAPVGVT